jgi:Tol biopolymer transport system component/DNA-binding winged helix-turn-helix (wHTH) protein
VFVTDRRAALRVGEWTVRPELNSMTREDAERHIEPKVMKVLLVLASRQGHVVSKEELISAVWPDTFVSDDVLTRCISILRRITEDDPHTPRFIQTIPKVGYRLVAEVNELPDEETPAFEILAPTSAIRLEQAGTLELPITPTAPEPSLRRNRAVAACLAVALLAASMVTIWLYQRTRTRIGGTNSSFKTIQFTSYAGEQTQPAFAPDGKRIAFVWIAENSGSRRIYIKTIGSEDVRPLTPDTEDQQFSPAWSPDGRQIAYLAIGKDDLSLYVADAGSSAPPRRLLIPQEPSHWEQGALSWSPSGKSLIYPDHSGIQPNSSIFLLDLSTLHARSITDPPAGWEGDLNPAYSPDGRWIAFARASETAVRDIYFMSTTDGKVQQLTRDHMNIDSLAWTSDSASIVFSSNRGGKYALWKIGLREKVPQRLPVGTEDAYQPAVGPRPGQLAYSQGSAIWSIVRLRENPRNDSSGPEAVLTSTQEDSAPALSPSGEFFAFQSRRSGNQEIWIASARGDQLRQLTFMAGPLTGSPSWSNHQDRILFDSRPNGHSHIFCVPAAGGRPKQVTFGNVNDITPRWSHDDQTIYFRSNRGDRWQLWKISAAGGEPQPVTTGDGIVPQESQDGKWLYYSRGDEDGLWRVSPQGGAETQILPQPAAGYWGYWQVTSRGIFYLDRGASSTTIRIFDPETRRSTLFATLKQPPPLYSGLTVAEDGAVVLMTDQREAGRHITFVEAEP